MKRFMKYFIYLYVTLAIVLVVASCTENQRARTFGGTTTIEVEHGKKVMMATWKEDNLFYMVEDMEDDYVPHNKELIESSSWGVIESKVVFKESR